MSPILGRSFRRDALNQGALLALGAGRVSQRTCQSLWTERTAPWAQGLARPAAEPPPQCHDVGAPETRLG